MNNLDYPIPVLELVTALKQLPGIGTRGAERMALWMLQGHMGEAEAIARTIGQAAEHVTPCPVCGFFSTEGEPCVACRDEERDSRLICVVEQATDVIPIERSSAYRGLYHCLGGKLSPLDDVEPEDLNIQSLMERISRQPDCEVILATGSDVEGEATATYLHHLLKEMDCRISRPAQGLPAGSGLSHADTLTLMKDAPGCKGKPFPHPSRHGEIPAHAPVLHRPESRHGDSSVLQRFSCLARCLFPPMMKGKTHRLIPPCRLFGRGQNPPGKSSRSPGRPV